MCHFFTKTLHEFSIFWKTIWIERFSVNLSWKFPIWKKPILISKSWIIGRDRCAFLKEILVHLRGVQIIGQYEQDTLSTIRWPCSILYPIASIWTLTSYLKLLIIFYILKFIKYYIIFKECHFICCIQIWDSQIGFL